MKINAFDSDSLISFDSRSVTTILLLGNAVMSRDSFSGFMLSIIIMMMIMIMTLLNFHSTGYNNLQGSIDCTQDPSEKDQVIPVIKQLIDTGSSILY